MSSPGHKRCLGCGYILDYLPEPRCPECGRVFDPTNPNTYAVRREPSFGFWFTAAVLGASIGPAVAVIATFARSEPMILASMFLVLAGFIVNTVVLVRAIVALRSTRHRPGRRAGWILIIAISVFYLGLCAAVVVSCFAMPFPAQS